jgi:hypothetical protein
MKLEDTKLGDRIKIYIQNNLTSGLSETKTPFTLGATVIGMSKDYAYLGWTENEQYIGQAMTVRTPCTSIPAKWVDNRLDYHHYTTTRISCEYEPIASESTPVPAKDSHDGKNDRIFRSVGTLKVGDRVRVGIANEPEYSHCRIRSFNGTGEYSEGVVVASAGKSLTIIGFVDPNDRAALPYANGTTLTDLNAQMPDWSKGSITLSDQEMKGFGSFTTIAGFVQCEVIPPIITNPPAPTRKQTLRDAKLGDRVRFHALSGFITHTKTNTYIDATVIALESKYASSEIQVKLGWLPYEVASTDSTQNDHFTPDTRGFKHYLHDHDHYSRFKSVSLDFECEILSGSEKPIEEPQRTVNVVIPGTANQILERVGTKVQTFNMDCERAKIRDAKCGDEVVVFLDSELKLSETQTDYPILATVIATGINQDRKCSLLGWKTGDVMPRNFTVGSWCDESKSAYAQNLPNASKLFRARQPISIDADCLILPKQTTPRLLDEETVKFIAIDNTLPETVKVGEVRENEKQDAKNEEPAKQETEQTKENDWFPVIMGGAAAIASLVSQMGKTNTGVRVDAGVSEIANEAIEAAGVING